MPYFFDENALPRDGETRQQFLLEAIAARLGMQGVPLSSDGRTRRLQIVEWVAKLYGIIGPEPQPEPNVPTITKSIGTASRDYSTIVAWEADLDNAGIYSSGDAAVGECYNDSAFDNSITFDGGGTVGLASVKLTVPSGQRHTGTAGTGARIVCSANRDLAINIAAFTMEWLEINSNGNSGNSSTLKQNVDGPTLRWLILHDAIRAISSVDGILCSGAADIMNCIIYDITASASTSSRADGIRMGGNVVDVMRVQNCTIERVAISHASSTGNASGILELTANSVVQNTIVMTPSVAGSGTAACFSGTFNTEDHNMSSDATAGGTGSLTSKTVGNQFVSTTNGSEDYHLKTGADAIDTGTDLVTTPTGVNFDIDNYDRDAGGGAWDMGADEFVAVGGANPKGWFGMALYGPMQRAVHQ